MSTEQPSGNQAEEKPASEMSVDELQALLTKKQAEQESVTVEPVAAEDLSYVEMAAGEVPSSMSPEENERVAEAIVEAEGELKANMEELQSTAAEAETAFARAEEALAADPDAVKPKLTLEKIRNAFDKLNDGMNMALVNGGLLLGGSIGTLVGVGMLVKGQNLEGTDQNFTNMLTGDMTSYDWSSLGEQVTVASSFGSIAAIVATFTLAKLARKFKEKQERSSYFSARAV